MLNTDENALLCDFAETYHIYDIRSLPLKTAAAFACGLRENSRIIRRITGQKYTLDEILTVLIYDKLNWLAWTKTKGAAKGRNRPEPLADKLFKQESESENDIKAFENPEDFEKAKARILRGGQYG